ncbi:hypothetical protein [Crocosphaera sp.]|uniref:hypothetical protein n=1 Tax=Crocosphaera sp. TaxID=2729996 RepID=UPI003F224F85|nr:hypothetical protein [Crocosphaera sp.]
MFTNINNTNIIRNYVILAATVMLTSVALTDTFLSPTRSGQQERLNSYGQVAKAGFVAYSQKIGR